MRKIWVDFGDCEVVGFKFATEQELKSFLVGIRAGAKAWGCNDIQTFDHEPSHEQVAEWETA